VKVIDNPKKIVAAGLNRAIEESRGEVIVRVDGHCEIVQNYVSRCVGQLLSSGADGVGGVVETKGDTLTARAIAVAMSSVFGVGNAHFRLHLSESKWTDTIPFPAYKRSLLDAIGPHDEKLVVNEDDEYNYRIIKQGGKLLLLHDLCTPYFCRSTIQLLWRQYFRYGFWKVRVLQKHLGQMRLRQAVPSLFVLLLSLLVVGLFAGITSSHSLVFLVTSYLGVNLIVSFALALTKGFSLLPLLPIAFLTLHLSYGTGLILGILSAPFRRIHLLAIAVVGFIRRTLNSAVCSKIFSINSYRASPPLFGKTQSSRLQESRQSEYPIEVLRSKSLFIFDDQIYYKQDNSHGSDEAHILFMIGLSEHFREATFCARVSPHSRRASYPIPRSVTICGIPFYNDVKDLLIRRFYLWPSISVILLREIMNCDVVLASWPNPLSLLLLLLDKLLPGKRIFALLVRQNMTKLVQLRYKGVSRLAAALFTKFLEWQVRIWGKDHLFLTLSTETQMELQKNFWHVHRVTLPVLSYKMLENVPARNRPMFDTRMKTRLLYVGRLAPEKGVSILIKAVASLKCQQGKEIELCLVGDGEERPALVQLVKELGLTEVVVFEGYVSFGEWLFAHYRNADIFILPSLSEGTPNVLIEAMAFGLPIVASRVGGCEELIRDRVTGILTEPGSIQSLQSAVQELLDDPALCARLGLAAQSSAREFMMEKQQELILNHIVFRLNAQGVGRHAAVSLR
jgi:glycosyltransferase involved in cell wall biosynthesis